MLNKTDNMTKDRWVDPSPRFREGRDKSRHGGGAFQETNRERV